MLRRPTLIEIKSSQIIYYATNNAPERQLSDPSVHTRQLSTCHFSIYQLYLVLRYRSTALYEIQKRNECSEIVRYVDTFRDHCRYLEANANNNLTFKEMHEPI